MEENSFKITSGYTLTSTTQYTQYKVNVDNIKTLDDVKLIFKHLNMYFTPHSKEDYEEVKHLLIVN